MRVSGAYWRADQSKAQLQRVYGTAYFDKKELKAYLHFLEEAKKRNHRKIGEAQDLFSFHDEAPGMPFIHPKGMVIWNTLLDYWREEHKAAGYVETKTPIILRRLLWEQSGHWKTTGKTCTPPRSMKMEYAIKPMNLPRRHDPLRHPAPIPTGSCPCGRLKSVWSIATNFPGS